MIKSRTLPGLAGVMVVGFVLFVGQNSLAGNLSNKAYPVAWYEGLSISFSLKEPVELSDVKQIESLLEAEWYSHFTVFSGRKSENKAIVKSCIDYISIRGKGYTPLQSNAAGPFMNIAMKCSAIQALSQAKLATKSYMLDLVPDKSLPGKLPKQLAFMTSSSDYERMIKDANIKTITDVYKINKTEIKDKKTAHYHHPGGIQEVTLVGVGDFNGDQIQDALLLVQNNVDGGSFSSTHLYSLTRRQIGGKLELLREFEY